MPAKSPEALAHKRATRKLRREKRFASVDGIKLTNVAKRRMMPVLPEMTKTELREMLAQAVRNT